MRRGIDFSTMTRTERLIVLFGVALFVNALIPYWYRVRTPRATFFHNGGLFGWGVVTALAGFAAVVIVVLRHTRTPATFNDRATHVALGLVATLALAVHGATSNDALWIGYWIELALSLLLVASGLRRIRERRRGWV